MADEIIRVIEVDTSSSVKTVRELQQEIAALKKKLQELKESTAEYATTQQQASEKQRELNEAMKITDEGATAQIKSMQELRQVVDQNTGSFGFLVSRAQELKIQIDTVNEDIKGLTKAYEEGAISVEDYNRELQSNFEELQKLKTEQGNVRSSLNASTKTLLAAEGSYVEASQTLGQLRNAFRNLSKEQREAAKGQEMLEQIKLLDAELKDVDASMGNFQRNVGGYEEALKQLLPPQAGLLIDLGKLSVAGGGIPSLFKGIAASIAGMTKAALAFIATPLGAVLTVAAAAGTAAMALFNAHNKKIEEQAEASAKALEKEKEKMDRLTSSIDFTIKLLRAQGKEAEADAMEMKKFEDAVTAAAFAYEEFKDKYEQMSDKEKEANEENRKTLLDRYIDARDALDNYLNEQTIANAQEIASEQKKNEVLAKERQRAAAERKKDAETTIAELLAQIAALNEEMNKGTEAGDIAAVQGSYDREMAAFNKMVEEKGISEETASQYRIALARRTEKEIADIQQQYALENIDKIVEEDERSQQIAADTLARNLEDIDTVAAYRKMEAEATIDNETELRDQLFTIEQEKLQAQLDTINTAMDSENLSFEEYERLAKEKEKLSIQISTNQKKRHKEDAKEEEKIEKLKRDTALKIASSTLGSLSSILGEETAAGKAAAVAQATIDTYLAANSAYASLSGIPIVGPALGAAAAAAAVVAGIANVKKILATKTDGSGPTAAPSAPSTPAIVNPPAVIREVPLVRTMTDTSEEELLNAAPKDQRVYLVYSDVEEAQNRVRVQQEETSF